MCMIRPVTLWPFPEKAFAALDEKKIKDVLCVEMSMGQMIEDVKLALNCRIPVSFYGRTGGVVPTPDEILGEIKKLANK